MSMSDPIADMLTRIRNAHARMKREVYVPASNLKVAILKVLQQEGYINAYQLETVGCKKTLCIELKYFQGKAVIEKIQRVSKSSLRCYRAVEDLPTVMGGLGTAVISTAKGVMTDKSAREAGVGGEVLCIVA